MSGRPLFCFYLSLVMFFLPLFTSGPALAADGPTEALEIRFQAEKAIAQERTQGHAVFADAMQEALPSLLQEYLVTRDGTIATDAVESAFVQEQFKVARALEEPGVALALDVFSGPGTGYENDLKAGIANLAEFHADQVNRVSEKTLDAHERLMERQLEKIESNLEKTDTVAHRFDSKFEAKIEARLDAVAQRAEKTDRTAEKAERPAETAQQTTEKAQEKTEKAAEKIEQKAEKAEEKAEKAAEKAQEKTEKAAEKTEEKAEKKAEKDEEKSDKKESKKK